MIPFRRIDRKYRASTQHMSITYFKLQDNQTDFRVGVIGSRKIPYILNFCQSTMSITCTCPDYEKREHKPLCKHMLFIVNLSNQKSMFTNLTSHNELKDATKLSAIRDSLMAVIDQKKMSIDLSELNTVSIERDDFCSICMCDLDGPIEKCSICAHVIHILCLTSWWDLTNSWNSIKSKCPYCKDPRGFAHIKNKNEDPWNLFDFHEASAASEAPEAAPEVLFQDLREFPNLHQLVFGRIPEQNSIENLRIQLDQELQVREEIVSDISVLRIETEFQRRLIIQLESLENERQIIQDLLQP